MKIHIITGLFFIFFFSAVNADTIEYLNGEELVIVVDLMNAKLQDEGSSYTYIDLDNGYANKTSVVFSSVNTPKIRIVNTKKKNNRALLGRHLKKTWNGLILLKSGHQIHGAAIGIDSFQVKDSRHIERYSIIENKRVCMTTVDNNLKIISLDRIKEIQFYNSGQSIVLTLKNDNQVKGTFCNRQGSMGKTNFMVCGIDLDTVDYFEVPITGIQKINTERLNPNLLCNNNL